MANAYPYLLLLIIFGFLAILNIYFQNSKSKQLCTNICAYCIFVFFFGFRGFVAYDWTAYFDIFNKVPNLAALSTNDITILKTEPGFLLLISICKTIVPNYIFFQFTCTLINSTLLGLFAKRYTNNLPLVLAIFLAMSGIVFSIDLMRNSLAIFIFLNAIPFLEKRQFIPYIIICGIAATFHTSAIIYIPIYFLIHKKWNKKILISIFMIANIIFLLHIPIFKPLISLIVGLLSDTAVQYVDAYMDFDSQGSNLGIGVLERLLTGILLFCYFNKLIQLRKSNIWVNCLFLYLATNLFLGEFRTISTRCSNLFIFAYWIVWIDLVKCIHYKSNKIIYITFIGMYCILKTYSTCSGSMSQYYNVLLDHQTHNERYIYFRQHQNDK